MQQTYMPESYLNGRRRVFTYNPDDDQLKQDYPELTEFSDNPVSHFDTFFDIIAIEYYSSVPMLVDSSQDLAKYFEVLFADRVQIQHESIGYIQQLPPSWIGVESYILTEKQGDLVFAHLTPDPHGVFQTYGHA